MSTCGFYILHCGLSNALFNADTLSEFRETRYYAWRDKFDSFGLALGFLRNNNAIRPMV